MKILMVISQFNPIIGGAEKQAQLLAKILIEKRIKVNVVTGWWDLRTPRKENIERINVYRNLVLWGPFGINGHRTLKKLGALVYMVSLCIYLLIHGHKYDLIHVHQALHPAFVSIFIGKLLRKPVIVKTVSSGITSDIQQLKRYPLGNFQVKYLLRNMKYLVAVTRIGGQEFNNMGFPGSQIEYIPNGVVLPPEGKTTYGQVKRVMTTARLSKEKGIDILIRAWANVVQQEKNLKLIIIGNGPLERELKELCKTLGVLELVEFAGMVQNAKELVRDADLFVLPSRAEGMSNALLEAMSYGLPCIATNVGGNVELICGDNHHKVVQGEFIVAKNGLLVNPDDVRGISEAMVYLIRNRMQREEMGNNGRVYIGKNYSIDLIADKYIALYQRMVDRKS